MARYRVGIVGVVDGIPYYAIINGLRRRALFTIGGGFH